MYEFKSTMDEKVDELVKQFDNQIKKEYKTARGNKHNCPSYWHKLIFLKSINLSINDWREIRTGDYYLVRDSLSGIEQSKFIHGRIIDYLG